MNFENNHDSLEAAQRFDSEDELRSFKDKFVFPKSESNRPYLYFGGHSLGLMPKTIPALFEKECAKWGEMAVSGHLSGSEPWVKFHEQMTDDLAMIVGGKPEEVVSLSTLTVNLHLALVSFYRPTQKRFKILIENNTFPSDHYAVSSQARFHGFDPVESIIQLEPDAGEMTVSDSSVLEQIERDKDHLSLVMLGNCNYLSGQCFDFESIISKCREHGINVGFNLAHGAGNLELKLNQWAPDFAVWCTYKYLNGGPGAPGGLYINERHLGKKDIPRFEGWWGHNKETRFKMGPEFDPIPTAEAWLLSNSPILSLIPVRESLQMFRKATMKKLIEKRDNLTGYMEFLLKKKASTFLKLRTPQWRKATQSRGAMLCYEVKGDMNKLKELLALKNVMADFREPNIFRLSPPPIYTSYEDVFRLSEVIKELS